MNASPTPFAHSTPPPPWVTVVWTATPLMKYFVTLAEFQCERQDRMKSRNQRYQRWLKKQGLLPQAAGF